MTKQEMVVSALRELGYKPQTDNDGDVFICYQMKHFYVMGTQDEENYLTVLFPQFYSISEGDETKVLAACNKANVPMTFVRAKAKGSFMERSTWLSAAR